MRKMRFMQQNHLLPRRKAGGRKVRGGIGNRPDFQGVRNIQVVREGEKLGAGEKNKRFGGEVNYITIRGARLIGKGN